MKLPRRTAGALFLALPVLAILIYLLPPVQARLAWRLDFAQAYARNLLNPAGELPTPLPPPRVAVTSRPTTTPTATLPPTQTATPTPGPTQTPTPSPTPIPPAAALPAPKYEKQDINNCGPATLAMYLRHYGWEGDQFTISDLLKPQREDRNVNVEEIAYYVRTRAGWLNVVYRVGGDLELIKRLVAAGFPVMLEEAFVLDQQYWPNDDRWGAHYFLVNAYDDARQRFTGQDSFVGPDRQVSYAELDEAWKAFNRVYILVYLPGQEEQVRALLGEDWDETANRRKALEQARLETEANPDDAYAWFNVGTNQVYFEDYLAAARAYDEARRIGLPQRMLRYQFGPFFAYFHTLRNDDLLALTEYALKITPNSEEGLLWRGWGLYRAGKTAEAIASFQAALAEQPNYADARYALDYVQANP